MTEDTPLVPKAARSVCWTQIRLHLFSKGQNTHTMLSVQRPTQTTILYKYSTRSEISTLTAHAVRTGVLLSRILVGLFVGTLLLREYHNVFGALPFSFVVPTSLKDQTLSMLWSQLTRFIFQHSTRPWRLLVYSGVVWLILRRFHTEESLLVIRGLGVQTSTSASSYLWASSTRFIPTSTIQDIFIHEAFKGFEVRFYLSIVVEDAGEVVVVFPNILPRREVLEDVWRGARACLYEQKT